MLVALDDLTPSAVYHLLTQVVVPRPIAWVVTDNGTAVGAAGDGAEHDGAERWNVAPYSFFNAVASDPPTVAFSVGRSPRSDADGGAVKDTLANLEQRGRLTIALAHHGQLEAVEATAAPLPAGRGELAHAGLTAVDWGWDVPRPAGVRVALGCDVDRIVPVGDGPQRLVLARVGAVWLDDDVVGTDDRGRLRIGAETLDPLARLGAGLYGRLGAVDRPRRPAHRAP